VNQVPRWRIAAGVFVLVALVAFCAVFTPIYFRNFELQNFVGGMTQRVETPMPSDEILRTRVLDKARQLGLPVAEDNVHILHSPEGSLRIDVRYSVRVDLPGYTVALHFYPGAGSR
jgi:hypothetical protein